MEFVLGAVTSFVALSLGLLIFIYINRHFQTDKIRITYRQSNIFELIRPTIARQDYFKEPSETQARKHSDGDRVTVLVLEDSAYWIKDNMVFQSSVINGTIDQNNVKVVDTMGMDKVELDKLSYIVDTLTKGNKDDRGYSGDKKF